MKAAFVAISIAFIALRGADAQRLTRVGVGASASATFDSRELNGLGVGGSRLVASTGAMAVGFVAGGFLGYRALPHCGGCEDPGLEQMVYGAFVGGAIGAAIGAAAPDLRSACTFEERFSRSLVGSGVAAAGIFILSGGLHESQLLLIPAGSVAGALGSLGRCWKPRSD